MEQYLDQLEKGIEFNYDEFEKQLENEWIQGYSLAYRYYIFHNSLDIPIDYYIEGFNLGQWLHEQRENKRELTVNQKELLNTVEINWGIKMHHHRKHAKEEIRYGEEQYAKWIENYLLAKQYYQEYHNLDIPTSYVVYNEQGEKIRLGVWVSNQRTNYKAGRIPTERMVKLDSIGMVYDYTHRLEIDRINSGQDSLYLPEHLKRINPFSNHEVKETEQILTPLITDFCSDLSANEYRHSNLFINFEKDFPVSPEVKQEGSSFNSDWYYDTIEQIREQQKYDLSEIDEAISFMDLSDLRKLEEKIIQDTDKGYVKVVDKRSEKA